MATKIGREPAKLYDTDFVRWTEEQTAALRSGRFDALDLENLAEEIESLGKRDRRRLKSRLAVLAMHLLKWRYQPEKERQMGIDDPDPARRDPATLGRQPELAP